MKVPLRVWIAIMIYLTTFTNYMARSNISVTILSMVLHTDEHDPRQLEDFGHRFDWGQHEQALVLGGYFYGYMLGCLPAGIIVELLGPTNTILLASVTAAMANSLTHPAAYLGIAYVVCCRALIGFGGALIYPAVHVLVARWAPPDEKGRFMAAMFGDMIGTVFTWYSVGEIVTITAQWHWGLHFVSIFIGIYAIVFKIICADSPVQHRWITEKERDYIVESQHGTIDLEKAVPPYAKILTSIRFWAMCAAHFGNMWGLYLILSGAPKYIHEVLGYSFVDATKLATLPYLFRAVSSIIFGTLGDCLQHRQILMPITIRRYSGVPAYLIPGLLLASMILFKDNAPVLISFLVLTDFFNGAVVIAHLQNPQELAPNFAGTMYSLISFAAGFTGILTPLVASVFTHGSNNVKQWSYVFCVAAGIYVVSFTFYFIFVTTETQSWNEKDHSRSLMRLHQSQTATG